MQAADEVRQLLDKIRDRSRQDPIIERLTTLIETLTEPFLSAQPIDELSLSKSERRLYELLASRPGHLFSDEQLLSAMCYDHRKDWPELDIIKVRICWLRKRLAAGGSAYEIDNEWGQGYRLVPRGSAKYLSNRQKIKHALAA